MEPLIKKQYKIARPIKEDKLRDFLFIFACRVIKNVSTQTHTDWQKYLDETIEWQIKQLKNGKSKSKSL